jgi:FtsZ-binding cell division protein ZapB
MSDMTQSFIEMVEAFKAKPELEAKIADLTKDNAMCYGTIDQLRFEIETLKSDKDSLSARLSEVTKERDDASFRNLELDEKLAGIEKLLGVAERLEQARREGHQAGVDSMTPKPEPVQVAVSPEAVNQVVNSYPGPIDPVMVEGQSESLPTTQTPSDNGSPSEIGSSSPAPTEPKINPYSGFPIHYPDGEYKGQPYYDKPSWVSWAAFVDAGGEAEPYMKNFG